MRHLMITSSDETYGDFLLNHWLVSLLDNVDLRNIDVIVIDYGLSESQRDALRSKGIRCDPSEKDGNVTNIRYREISRILSRETYDQVMSVDGGDIIFQADISPVFETHKDRFRAVCDEFHVAFHEAILPRRDISPEIFDEIFYFLKGKQRINGGLILGPAEQFKKLWAGYQELTQGYEVFGTDQFVMNYILYKNGFVRLESKYNFVILSTRSSFSIKKGVFHDKEGEPIPVVHNAGWTSLTRCIRKFGYGEKRNKRKWITYWLMRLFFGCANCVNKFRGYY